MSDHKAAVSDYDLHSGLGFRLSRISKLMQTRLEKGLGHHGISRLEWCVISGIGLQDIATPSGLADHIGITRQAISRLLVQMRKSKLIAQSPDQTDGRSRRLTLTELGANKLVLCRTIVDENHDHFASKLSPESLDTLITTLDKLSAGEVTQLDKL